MLKLAEDKKNFSRPNRSILIICLLGFCIGLFLISKQSLWLDEYTSIEVADHSPGSIMSGHAFDNRTPPFYYLLLHYWIKLGKNEFILRSFSLIFGIMCIYLIYYFCKMFLDTKTAVISAFLTAISPFHVYYSQEGRMYTLFMALSMAAFIAFLKLLSEKKVKNYFLFFTISVMGLYTHYYFAFLLIVLNCVFFYHYLITKTTSQLKEWLLVECLTFASLLPWLPVLSETIRSGDQHRTFLFSVIPYTFFRFNVGYAIFPLNPEIKGNFVTSVIKNIKYILLVYPFFGILTYRGFKESFKKDYAGVTLSIWLIVPILLSAAISVKSNMMSERYLIFLFPAYIMLIAFAISSIKSVMLKRIVAAICCLIFCLGLCQYYFSKDFGKEQWREAAAYISKKAKPEDLILVAPEFFAPLFTHYYQRKENNQTIIGIKSKEKVMDMLALHPNTRETWLVQSGSELNDKVINHLKNDLSVIKEKKFPYESGIIIYSFKRKGSGW